MRVGDFAVEVVASHGGLVRELDSGHVLARAGQLYNVRLRNFGPLYCVVAVEIDGKPVTGAGLVLEPWGTTELERPVHSTEDGRFTVVAEGDETVFGADGGRDNDALGLIAARFRRELPRTDRHVEPPPNVGMPALPASSRVIHPAAPVEPWRFGPPEISAFDTVRSDPRRPSFGTDSSIERAAGTGLTGHSDQRFVVMHLGPLEAEATVIELRLVVGTDTALADDTPRAFRPVTPARPEPRP
ncbi:MAG TPA: hypothetical protein VII52_07660 [Gemmatimonadaceae bacterium]